MGDETIWKLNIQGGNTIPFLDDLESRLLSVKKHFNDVAGQANKAAANFKQTTAATADLASKAISASNAISPLSNLQNKVSESAKRLEVAQAQAALAFKKAEDAANNAKLSTEQVAVAQARAALAAEKVKGAQDAIGRAMQKVTAESERLAAAQQEATTKISPFSRALETAQSALSNMGSRIRAVAIPALAALGIALAGIGVAIAGTIPAAGNFDETMRLIGTSSELSEQEVRDLSQAVLQMGPDVRKGPLDLASGLLDVTQAGYQSGQAIDILRRSAQQAAVGMTDTKVVVSGATKALNAFPALETAKAFDIMTKAVFLGATDWNAFAPAIGKVSLLAQFAGASFEEASTALSVLTNVMPSTEQAATSLTSLFQTSSRFSELAKRAGDLGIAFDVNAYKSMNFIDRLKYLQQATDGNTESLAYLVQQEEALPAITALLTDGAKDYSKALQDVTNSAGAADAAFKKTGEGAKASWARATAALESLQIKIGTVLLPVVDLFSERIAPLTMQIADWIEKSRILENIIGTVSTAVQNINVWVGSFTGTGNALMPVLAGIGAVLATVLVPAVWSLAAGVIAATWPFLLIGAAVAGLTAVFLHFYNSNAGFRDFINGIGQTLQQLWTTISTGFIPTMQNLGNIIQTQVFPVLQNIGSFLLANFKPVWDQLVVTFQTQLVPAWNQLVAAIQPAIPIFQFIGGIILGVLVISLGVLISTIAGLVSAVAGALPGIIQAFGGIVQFISGALQFILGLMMFFNHLFTLQFDKLGADLGVIWQGIVSMFSGAWNLVQGIFNASIGIIKNYVFTFVGSIIGFFTMLFDKLVGHSIIPDMINGIINWFAQLPSRALDAVQSLLGRIRDFFGDLAGKAIGWGANIISNVASGISNAIVGGLTGPLNRVGQFISDHLPHSPARLGPLRELEMQGSLIPEQVAAGMRTGMPRLQAAIDNIATPISMSVQPPLTPAFAASSPRFAAPGGNDQTTQYLAQMVALLAQIVALQQQSKAGNATTNMTLNARPVDVQRLYQAVESMAGFGYEGIQRGAW